MNKPNIQDREQFLLNLKSIASAAANVEEIAYKLGFDGAKKFEKFLDNDKEAKDIWKQARLDCWIKSKAAITIAAQEGKARAIEVLDGLLKAEQGSGITENVSITQLANLTGKSSQTIYNWVTKHGLPREKDKTFNLPKFFVWFEKYKFEAGKKQVKVKSSNTLQDIKVKKLQQELKKDEHELLDRKEVISGITARYQRLLLQHSRLIDVATQCEGKSLKQIIEVT